MLISHLYKLNLKRKKQNKLIYGIQVIKTEYKDKIGVEQEKIEHITNDENEITKNFAKHGSI